MEDRSKKLKLAAGLLALYGVLALVHDALVDGENGGGANYLLLSIRPIWIGVMCWGLLKKARWAWWVSVVLNALWLVAGLFRVGLYARIVAVHEPLLFVLIPLQVGILFLLGLPETRAELHPSDGKALAVDESPPR
ncbi:MAG TPA: hypothetical protein VNI01_13015 [Elusimicrobiota bacterium]|jgi:hypothetical protein|nr:hypothetical protein [Elusimicrobiota bacterium]